MLLSGCVTLQTALRLFTLCLLFSLSSSPFALFLSLPGLSSSSPPPCISQAAQALTRGCWLSYRVACCVGHSDPKRRNIPPGSSPVAFEIRILLFPPARPGP